MRPARSRRVQAQRKFAQGAYVPPNVVAVAAADNRRDAAHDARNVTINHLTATNLLDVVSLQSAATTPDKIGMHSHLLPQPVVLIERLRGNHANHARNQADNQADNHAGNNAGNHAARPGDPQPSGSQAIQPPPLEHHHDRVNENTNKINVPELRSIKKKKEFKRVHVMSLRPRRLSKLELNRLMAESCTPIRKPPKRSRTYSDDDEPLILQASPRHKIFRNSSHSPNKRSDSADTSTAIAKKRTPKLSTCKKRTFKRSSTKESTPKRKTAKKISPKPRTSKKSKQPANILPKFTFAAVREEPVVLDDPLIKENLDDLENPDRIIVELPLDKEMPSVPILHNSDPNRSVDAVTQTNDPGTPDDPVTLDDHVAPTVPDTMNDEDDPDAISISSSPLMTDSRPMKHFEVLPNDPNATMKKHPSGYKPTIYYGHEIPEVRVQHPDVQYFNDAGITVTEEATEVDVPRHDDEDSDDSEDSEDTPQNQICKIVKVDSLSEMRMETPEPVPGTSGMQYEFEVYDPINQRYKEYQRYTGNRYFQKSTYQHILKQTGRSLETARAMSISEEESVPPETCITQEWSYFQEVIKAPEEVLAARCKKCTRCIRIAKLIKISALLKTTQLNPESTSEGQDNNVAALLTCPITEETDNSEQTEQRDDSENEDIEILDEERAVSPAKNRSHQYYDLIPKHATLMIKLGSHMVHGKDLLSVSLAPRTEDQEETDLSLPDPEHLLDRLFDTMSLSLDENPEDDKMNVSSTGLNGNGPKQEELEEPPESPPESQAPQEPQEPLAPQESQIVTKRQKTQRRDNVSETTSLLRTIEEVSWMRLAEVEKIHELIREKKDKEIALVEERNRVALSRLIEERDSFQAENLQFQTQFTQLTKERDLAYARMRTEVEATAQHEMAANLRLEEEVDILAKALEKEPDAKEMSTSAGSSSGMNAPGTSASSDVLEGGTLVNAPVYYPTEEEFQDPIKYYEKIWAEAARYGICKIVPPPGWEPPCRVHEEIRFVVTNQYVSRLFNRWGPAARELSAIKLCLKQQNVNFSRPPLLEGVEVNLPKLYHIVQRHGGLETVINKNRWGKVAEDMKFSKLQNTEKRLDQIYVKFLLPYDTLSHQERQEIMRKVEIAWNKKSQKLLDRAMNPLYRQKKMLGLMDSSDDETEDEDTATAVSDAEDCVIKGGTMTLARFQKVAAMAFENTFGQRSEAGAPPSAMYIEEHYWRLVTLGTEHMCVYTAAIDTGEEGYGFPKNKNEEYGSHPFNPKMISHHPRNVLRYLSSVLGLTVPTLLLGMLFSTSCWHKDPHALPWLEYQHKGPTRIWYAIASDQADNFRKAVETLSPSSCQNKGLWLPTDISMIPPHVLREHNVSLSRLAQDEKEFIVAFPNAYTCCINTGYTESESVYFAPPSWLDSLWMVFKEARESCEPTMFAMEHLLYNIGKDTEADVEILKIAQPLFDKMLREEVTNRQMLQERGLSFVKDIVATTSKKNKKANAFNAQDEAECEYCRASLFLSKVKGLTSRDSILCLEHALKLLDTDKYKDADVSNLVVLVHVSVKELNTIFDDMTRRLGKR